jgi:hypothetical protein
MIDRISDVKIRETVMEETTQAQEPQAQDKIAAEVEPIVQATPEYKSGLVAEKRLESQAQEMLLSKQLQNDTRSPVSFTRDPEPPRKPVGEFLKDTLKQAPGVTKAILGDIAEKWSDPVGTLDNAAEQAKQKWNDIKAGK